MKKHTITHYSVNIHRPEMKAASIRAAFVTDLHNTFWKEDPDVLPDIIAQKKPDVILCGGDIIVARPGISVERGLYFMRKMQKIADVYYALGNHEYRSRIYPETYGTMYEDLMEPLQEEGVKILDNENQNVSISGCEMAICGLSLPRSKYKRFKNPKLSMAEINKLIGRPDPKRLSILLAHNPKYYDTYLAWGADITLCGHYHGGIVRFGKHTGLISPGLRPFPDNAYGRFDRNGKTVIISAGLGEHTLPLRIRNPRELVLLDININQK